MAYLRSLEGKIDDPNPKSIEIMLRFLAKISKDESERLPLLTYCIESSVNLKNQILFNSYANFIALILNSDAELEKYIMESIFGSETCCLKKSRLYWVSLHYKLLYAKNISAEAASNQVASICKYFLERIKVSSGMNSLISSIEALKTLLDIPELPMIPLFFRQIILYAFQVFISDKLKIDVAAKGLLLDGLIEVAKFLRNLERSFTIIDRVQFDLDYFFALPVSIDLKESILDGYKKFNNYSPSDMSKKTSTIEGHWNVLLLGSLNGLSEKIILFLLKVVSDQTAPLKVKSIRGMITILDKNDTFCSSSGFIDIIISKTKDASVSVRDASLELISKCFDNHQLTSDKFFEAVLSRIQDSSLCVRKRVIKLLANIVSVVNEYNVEEVIIAKLLLVSADDEENMSNLAVKLIKERWISRVCMQSLRREDLILFVASTIRVIKHLEERSDALQSFISKLFNSKNIDEHFEKACALIVDVLFESLVSAIEVANYPAVTFILKAILVFVSHNFSLLEGHLRLLYELIKSNEMQVIELALYLMKESMPFCSRASINPIVSHVPDITRLVLKGSEAVIKNAVEFLRKAVNFLPENHPDVTFELWNRFDQFLESKLNSKIDKNINLLLCRALFSYGCLTHSLFQRGTIEPHFLDRPLQVLSIFFGHALKSANASLAFYALQPCGLLIGIDNELVYRQEISRILHLSLSSSVPQLISCVLEIFLNISMKSKSTQSLSFNTSMQNDEANISSSIVQNFIKELVASIYLDEPKCHYMALKLFSLVILYGFSHPNQVIPSIVALSTSKISNVSSKALEIIQLLQETHFSFLYSNYSDILKACFQFHSTNDTPRGFQLTDDSFHSILDAYYFGIRGKRSKRDMFLELLLKEVEIGLSNTETVNYSLFCIEILSMLTFKTFEELSFVLLKLDDTIFPLSNIEQNSNMDLIKFCYLIELKHYLRRTYNISNEYCFPFCTKRI
jgi:cohesin loading factor subunit SCC2